MTIKHLSLSLILVFIFSGLSVGCSSTASDTNSCKVETEAGQCPNFCTSGTGVKDEVCSGKDDCECGLFCKAGSCQAYEGGNANCSCEEPTPTSGDDNTGGDDSTDSGTDSGSDAGSGTDSGSGSGGTGNINDCDKNPPAGSDCNPYCQLGCAAERNCTFSGGDFVCSKYGTKEIGNICNSSKDCGLGLACLGLTGEPQNTCRKFCIGDSDCPDGRSCTLNVNFSSGPSASFCSDISVGCSAFDASDGSCAEGQACYLSQNATKCMDTGNLTEGAICHGQGPNVCEAGLQCLVVCTQVCSYSDVNDDEPKCFETCADTKYTTINEENFIGICLTAEIPQACHLFEQTGCAAGEACYTVKGGWACISEGVIKPGEACKFTNDCIAGSLCVNSTCNEVCSSRPEDTEKAYACDTKCSSSNNITPAEWGIGFCTDTEPAEPCDFWTQDCTDLAKVCYFVSNGATCLDKGGSAKEGDDCKFAADCDPGLMCAQGQCVKPCSLNELAPPGVPICVEDCPGGEFTTLSFENQIGVCK